MQSLTKCLLVLGVVIAPSAPLGAQNLPDLVIHTTSQYDVLRGGVKIEPEPIGGELHQYRSYLMAVSIRNLGTPTSQPFTVRTECVRPGSRPVALGQARIVLSGGSGYALYDIFPSSAGAGACELQTTVDADLEVAESSESMSVLSGQKVPQVHAMPVQIMP